MNLADPELELLDPTPNIHSLFVHFDQLFFFTTLMSRALVRWSKRMYSCAGVCSYEGKNGICDIALSEPLLKLRPRKDLVQTLLHEMIHAYLFITNKDNDRDGHGPAFKAHMHRINRAAGLNISIYHDFHDEVELYQKHWWRCDGICQKMKPYFGVFRRPINRAPGPYDRWWKHHSRLCGGTFIKIKEPEKQEKLPKVNQKAKANGDITKYINNNNDNTVNKNVTKSVIKGNKIIKEVKTVVPSPSKTPITGNILSGNNRKRSSGSVIEKVRDVWKDKLLNPSITVSNSTLKSIKPAIEPNKNKQKADSVHIESPPQKIKKIDDYFKTTAGSILKDVYGKEFTITQSTDNNKLMAITANEGTVTSIAVNEKDLVDCPICNAKVSRKHINTHLDECLNKDIITELNKPFFPTTPVVSIMHSKTNEQTSSSYKQKTVNFENDNKSNTETSHRNGKAHTENLIKTKKTENDNKRQTDFIIPQTEINKVRPSTSNDVQICPCCGKKIDKPIELHLNECLGFFEHDTTIPKEGSNSTKTVVIEEKFHPFNTKIKNVPGTSKDVEIQKCPCCGKRIDKPIQLHLNECLGFFDLDTTIPEEGSSASETIFIDEDTINTKSKTEPGTSQDLQEQKCPCCGKNIDKPIEIHLDECLGFFDNDTTIPQEGNSTIETIVIDDDDDEFDETQIFNATGTKSPCPCCLKMVEGAEMNDHLDVCLGT